MLNINPVAPTYADSFAPEAVYELKVDTNADAIPDIAYRFTFSPKANSVQKATVKRVSGEQAKGSSNNGDVIFQDVPVYFEEKTKEASIARVLKPPSQPNLVINGEKEEKEDEEKEYSFFAGIRSDPFFFDLEDMRDIMQFTGADIFLDKNVFSIIL